MLVTPSFSHVIPFLLETDDDGFNEIACITSALIISANRDFVKTSAFAESVINEIKDNFYVVNNADTPTTSTISFSRILRTC